jgi:hypothetical protein
MTIAGQQLLNFPEPVTLTQNVINQPVFSARKVTTSVSVYDGQTVGAGRVDARGRTKDRDKTPIIGDIPLIGRAFRTNVDQHIKKEPDHFRHRTSDYPSGLAGIQRRGRRGGGLVTASVARSASV